jgi:hypothetical protein
VVGADLFWEKNTNGWFVPREKYRWLVADKPNEHGVHPSLLHKVMWKVFSKRLLEGNNVHINLLVGLFKLKPYVLF